MNTTPPRLTWSKQGILDMLRNRRYLGEMVWGRLHMGKYSECTADGVHRRRRAPRTAKGKLRQVRAPEGDAVVVTDAHLPLISRELWEAARRAIEARRDLPRGPARRNHKWPLSGLAFCAHCGGRMCGIIMKAGKKQGSVELRRYVCGNCLIGGRAACAYRHVGENDLTGAAFGAVRLALSDPESLRRIRAAVEAEAAAEGGNLDAQAEALRKKAADLDSKARTGAERLAVLPADMVDDVAAAIRRWREERDSLLVQAAQLDEVRERADDGRRLVEEAMQAFERLGEWMSDPEGVPADLQAQTLGSLVERLECRFEEHPLGPKRMSCRCVEVTVHFKDIGGILQAVNVPFGQVQTRVPSVRHSIRRRSSRRA
jgi:hypothetical protein